MKTNLVKIALGTATFLAAAYPVFAQVDIIPTEVPRVSVLAIIQILIRVIIIAAFVVAFLVLLIGGIRWMTSGGDPKNVEGARNMVTAGLVGLVIVLAAFALIRLVEVLFDIPIISSEITIPSIVETE